MNRYEEALKHLHRPFTAQVRPDCLKCRDYGGRWLGDDWLDCPACQQVKR